MFNGPAIPAYTCATPGVYETFEYTGDMLLTVTQPSILASLIERISIARGDGEPIVCTFSSDGASSVGTLQSPLIYPMDSDAADALLTAAENFRLGTRVKLLTDENRASYGLDTPQAVIKIAQREGLYSSVDAEGVYTSSPLESSALTLTVGDQDGEFFYFCEYEGTCFRVSSFLLSAFLNAEVKNYISLHPADMGDVPMQSVTVQTGEGTLDFYASYTENVLPNNELATDENGNVLYTENVTLNGGAVSADAFEALVARLGR